MTPDQSETFLLVAEQHKGILYKIAKLYCKEPEDREDLIQEILLQLWRSFPSYDQQYRHSTWIYRIALNVAISYYRKKKTRRAISQPFPETILDMAAISGSPVQNENGLLLQQFLNDLKELDKALMLLYLEEKSHKEIAAIMGITETNVATRINRVKAILKQKFSQQTT